MDGDGSGGYYGDFGGGGGYLNGGNEMGGGYDGMGTHSQDAGKEGKKGTGNNTTVTPLTIRMINMANQEPDDTFTVNGRSIGKFVAYGMVKSRVEKTTSFTLTLDDGTGRIDAQRWIEADESNATQLQRQTFVDGCYVCVIGILKTFAERRYINAFNVRLVSDHNELTHHFLDVIFVSLQITRGPINKNLDPNVAAQMKNESPSGRMMPGSGGGGGGMMTTFNPYAGAPTIGGSGVGIQYGTPGQFQHQYQQQQQHQQHGMHSMGSMGVGGQFNNHQQLVLQAFANDGGSETGFSVDEVAKRLQRNGITVADVRRVTDFLVQEGQICEFVRIYFHLKYYCILTLAKIRLNNR